jgi:hypothetical protein
MFEGASGSLRGSIRVEAVPETQSVRSHHFSNIPCDTTVNHDPSTTNFSLCSCKNCHSNICLEGVVNFKYGDNLVKKGLHSIAVTSHAYIRYVLLFRKWLLMFVFNCFLIRLIIITSIICTQVTAQLMQITVTDVRLQVLTAASMKIIAFCYIAPCSLVEVYRHFITLMEAVSTSETSVCFNETTRRYIPEGYYLKLWCFMFNKNVKSLNNRQILVKAAVVLLVFRFLFYFLCREVLTSRCRGAVHWHQWSLPKYCKRC